MPGQLVDRAINGALVVPRADRARPWGDRAPARVVCPHVTAARRVRSRAPPGTRPAGVWREPCVSKEVKLELEWPILKPGTEQLPGKEGPLFAYASSKSTGLYVGIYTGDVSDDDYARCVNSMTEFELELRRQLQGIAAILVTDPGVEAVPASWRKRMAEFNHNVRCHEYLLAIVTPSSVVRGILTAINWLSPAKQGHIRRAHETFADACAWIEKQRGHSEPHLDELYRAARAKLALSRTG